MVIQTLKPHVQEFLDGDKGMYINGQYVASKGGKTFDVLNPATEELIAQVPLPAEADIDAAVGAAREAFDNGQWTKMEPAERSHIIYKFANLLDEHREELAQIESLDNGKPYQQALEDDIDGTVQHFRYYSGWATKIAGQTPNVSPDYLTYTAHEPVGVVGQIIPWNYPLAMAGWKLGAALAAGCTIVIKPAEETPLSMLYAAKLFEEAGFPDGVVNVVPGPGDTAGNALVNHKNVDKIAFTGSTKTGSNIMKNAAEDIKSVTLELGGKSPSVVLEDADLNVALDGIFDGTMYNSGQNCSATTRIYVHRSIHDEVLDALVEKAEKVMVGPGLDNATEYGPLVSEKQLNAVLGYIDKGKEEGARLLVGGARKGDTGYFVEPTIFADVEDDMTIAREEIFGPVMSVFVFDELDEVISRANDSDYGLAASVWTENIRKGHYVASKLQAGTVWVNDFGLELETMPFGGYKKSGIGREMGGEYGISNYIEVKSVFVNQQLD